jgi:demethylspheroidene O-methyltransferase
MESVGLLDTPESDSKPAPRTIRPTWADRWFTWRNRLLANPLFQRRAAGFPLTRPVARKRAQSLFDLVAGFVYSQVLLACVRLQVFEMLSEGPETLPVLARRLGLTEASAERLLAAAVSLKLVERRSQGRFGLGVLGATMVGNQALVAMVEHHAALYTDLADPVALLRGKTGGGLLASYWPYAGAQAPERLPSHHVSSYSALMSSSQPLVAHEILDAYSLKSHRCLLDVGGGEGTFLMHAASQASHLKLVLFDLPAVSELARVRFRAAGLDHRAVACGGDFMKDPLPAGADIATLVRVVHDHDDSQAALLLAAVRKALVPGATLLLAEPMAGTHGAEAMGDAYFGFYLMAMGSGRPRTSAELTAMLHAAGFGQVRLLPNSMPMQTQILLATATQTD